jgi:shikimate dehydrogenase
VLTRLGVLGWPVGHSRSPAIQNAALAAAGLRDWRYQLLPVPPEVFADTVRALPEAGFRGANVTIPHKEAALALATSASDRARSIGAANVLIFPADGAGVAADNTDAPGLIAALPLSPAGHSAQVLGAGGSARAAVWALLDAGASDVWIWNRSPERAALLAAELGGTPVPEPVAADLLINCTSIGLDAQGSAFKQFPIAADHLIRYDCVVDLVYRDSETPLVQAARKRGIRVVEGLDLLVEQGALSFELFTGIAAEVDAMRKAVRS